MRLLLDTHAFAWALVRSSKLPARLLDWITDPANDVWVSAATIYNPDYKRPVDREIAVLPADLAVAGLHLGIGGWTSSRNTRGSRPVLTGRTRTPGIASSRPRPSRKASAW